MSPRSATDAPSSRSHQFARLAAATSLGALALFGAACKELEHTVAPVNQYGAINVAAKSASATSARGVATAIFFEALSAAVPNSAQQQDDACAFQPFDSIPSPSIGQNRAGETLALTVGSSNLSLAFDQNGLRYATPGTSPFTYQPGDAATVTIPGSDKFPASTISVKLAEPVVPGPIVVPAGAQPFVVTWTGTNDPTAAMLISLRYALGTSATANMEQIYCSAKDDGRFEIPANALTSFFAAPASSRSLSLTRYRTNEAQLASNALLHIASTADTVRAVR